jgi:CRP/FNR family transcriptional regulator
MSENNSWLDYFPLLKDIHDPAWLEAVEKAQILTVPKGATVFNEGDSCNSYLLVLEGSVRVQKLSESGKEIVLYRVESGQSCVITTSCLLAHDLYSAEAITETEVKAVAIPHGAFQKAVAESAAFREFIFSSYGQRIAGLVMLVDAVAFGRMDSRLSQCLLERADAENIAHSTHQELARELGTAREVVSRLLKEFERHNWVALARGRIELLDRKALEQFKEAISV